MAIFQPVDMAGPANRGATLQRIAQGAAANVMRRQRMQSLLRAGAAKARMMPGGTPFRGSMHAHPTGVRSSILGGQGGSLADMLANASAQAGLPGGGQPGGGAGMLGSGGGGFDFASLPDPNDPSQSGASTMPDLANPIPPAPPAPSGAILNSAPAPAPAPSGDVLNTAQYPTAAPSGDILNSGYTAPSGTSGAILNSYTAPTGSSSGLIHLGGGMYYDPTTDSVRGGGR